MEVRYTRISGFLALCAKGREHIAGRRIEDMTFENVANMVGQNSRERIWREERSLINVPSDDLVPIPCYSCAARSTMFKKATNRCTHETCGFEVVMERVERDDPARCGWHFTHDGIGEARLFLSDNFLIGERICRHSDWLHWPPFKEWLEDVHRWASLNDNKVNDLALVKHHALFQSHAIYVVQAGEEVTENAVTIHGRAIDVSDIVYPQRRWSDV